MWPFKRKNKELSLFIRLHIIEGRCPECHKHLKLKLRVVDQYIIELTLIPCKEHPEDSIILYPTDEFRKDLIIER